MKKIKTVAIISGVLTALQLIPVIIQGVVMRMFFEAFDIKMASAVGIIGSADGPTSIVVIEGFSLFLTVLHTAIRYGFLPLCAITFIVSMVLYFKKKKQL